MISLIISCTLINFIAATYMFTATKKRIDAMSENTQHSFASVAESLITHQQSIEISERALEFYGMMIEDRKPQTGETKCRTTKHRN